MKHYPLDTRRKLNIHKTFRTFSELLVHVESTPCVYSKGTRVTFTRVEKRSFKIT